MAEELQSLLERIQKDGVDKAESQAETILEEARHKAADILTAAREEADELRSSAETEAEAFEQRANASLRQAARDVVLSVGEAIDRTFRGLAASDVSAAMTPEVIENMLTSIVQPYFEKGSGKLAVLLSEKDRESMQDALSARFADALKQGLEIRGIRGMAAGFRVSVVDDNVEHDFSSEAVTDALCALIRPRLAEVVRAAIAETTA